MLNELKPAVLITLVFTVLTGLLYPLAVTGAAQVLFHRQANGSLVERGGKVIGSTNATGDKPGGTIADSQFGLWKWCRRTTSPVKFAIPCV